MSVRRAVPTDARSLAEVHVASWQSAYRGLLPDALLSGLSVTRREESWQRLLTDPEQPTWAYEQEGRVVAFASIGPCRDADKDPSTVAELMTMYTLPEVWGQGVGRALWAVVLEHLGATTYREITLWVLTDNARARRFYERAGFRPDGTTRTETRSGGVLLFETRYARAPRRNG